jgi:hypothetical protein
MPNDVLERPSFYRNDKTEVPLKVTVDQDSPLTTVEYV